MEIKPPHKLIDLFEDTHILHLSDLHIESKDGKYSSSLKNLIDDIVIQLKSCGKVILVVSGDIVNKGNYSTNTKKAVRLFFTDLYDKIKEKVIDLEIVPGNHDKERNKLYGLLSKSIQSSDEELDEEEWDFQLKSFSSFMDMHREILSIFNLKDKDKSSNTFGISSISLKSGQLIFIRLDTSWCSYSDNDNGKLKIGKFQRDRLLATYKKEKENLKTESSNSNFLTIAISHHPLNLLSQFEEDESNKLLLSDSGLNVDILLCGHVHTLSLAHYFNHEHSLLTLVTGICGEDNLENNHRYSIYALNLANNTCDIIMRQSGKAQFNYDYSIYVGDKKSASNKLTYPIKVRESHAFIEMETHEIENKKRRFLDNHLLSKVPLVCSALSDFARNMANKNAIYKNDFLDKFRLENCSTEEDKKNYEELEAYFTRRSALSDRGVKILEKHYSTESFLAFLQEICDELISCLEDCFSQKSILRVHIRAFDKSNDEYKSLCYNTNMEKKPTEDLSPRSLKWNKFLEIAYKGKNPIIYSANLCLNEIDTSWDDFLTIIPDCIGIDKAFSQPIKGNKFENTKRPWLTFGLSFKSSSKSDSDILYILSFLGIQDIIKSIIDDYIDIFKIHLQDVFENNQSKAKRRKIYDKRFKYEKG
ncbi:MAG: metallophosphoesterase [Treponema sp.]|nr:metallophosphoesterase [Treponema sp.]